MSGPAALLDHAHDMPDTETEANVDGSGKEDRGPSASMQCPSSPMPPCKPNVSDASCSLSSPTTGMIPSSASAVLPTTTHDQTCTLPAQLDCRDVESHVTTEVQEGTVHVSTPDPKPADNATESVAETLDDCAQPDLQDCDDILLPVVSTRVGISEGKIRALFSRYGLSHPTLRRSKGEPVRKCRRVEKPIRVKMHWQCHECGDLPGREKKCGKCGHGRCESCSKAPATAVKELVETTKRLQEQDVKDRAEDTVTIDDPAEQAAVPEPDSPEEKVETSSPSLLATPLQPVDTKTEVIGPAQACEPMTPRPGPQLILSTRTRVSEELTFESRGQIPRRSCHPPVEPFLPVRRADGVVCGREPPPDGLNSLAGLGKRGVGSSRDDKLAPSAKPDVVRRVYKKPRMRVRYTCEHCAAVFIEQNVCTGCGHGRCKDCVRNPPKRTTSPDPIAIASVAHRLRAPHDPPSQPRVAAVD